MVPFWCLLFRIKLEKNKLIKYKMCFTQNPLTEDLVWESCMHLDLLCDPFIPPSRTVYVILWTIWSSYLVRLSLLLNELVQLFHQLFFEFCTHVLPAVVCSLVTIIINKNFTYILLPLLGHGLMNNRILLFAYHIRQREGPTSIKKNA